MCGGHGCRKFYIGEARRIEAEHQDRLPDSRYTVDEIAAGFDRLSAAYGVSLTIDNLVKETLEKEREIMCWKVSRFYYTIERFAWKAYTEKKYSEIQNKKLRKK